MKIDYRANDPFMQEKIEEGFLLVKSSVSADRFEHSVRVAKTAVILCEQFGENPDSGYYSGLMHDLSKEMPNETILQFIKWSDYKISPLEKERPSLLHGRVASIFLQKYLSITDQDILQAVCHHTFGCVSMCNLAKIIYVADKIEPGRPYNTKKYYEAAKKMTLNSLTECVAKDNIEVLEKKGRKIPAITQDFFDSLKK